MHVFQQKHYSVSLQVVKNHVLYSNENLYGLFVENTQHLLVMLHYNLGDISYEHCDFLFETELQVVCSSGFPPMSREQDLFDHTLLYSLHSLTVWRQWFDLAGIEPPENIRALRFGDASLAMQAAISGLGAALCETVCAAKDLETGRLVSPFPHRLRTGNKFFMTVNPVRAERPGVRAFREWVQTQARASAPIPDVTGASRI